MHFLKKDLDIFELLVSIKFANSKLQARRMILEKGIKIDNVSKTDINEIISIENDIIVKYGKNKFVKVCLNK